MFTPVPAAHEAAAHVWFHDHAEELKSRLSACFSRLDPDAREEAVADATARVWASVLSAAKRDKLEEVTPFCAALYAHAGHKCGRRFTGMSKTDVMAEATKAFGRTTVVSCDDVEVRNDGDGIEVMSLAEALSDPRDWYNPYENARRNMDYAHILEVEGVTEKARAAFRMLVETKGEARNLELARALGVSPARATQLKTLLSKALEKHGYRCPLGRSKGNTTKRRGRPKGQAKAAAAKRNKPVHRRANRVTAA